jgi:hypothetical protein
MPTARAALWRAVPVLLLLALYWPGVNTWFFQDDFGWLNLRHDVHSTRDLGRALFAPKAHGNMRPLGENAYWLALSTMFGADPLPFHVAAFLTQAASLLLLGAIVRRTLGSQWAAFSAQILWMVNIGIAPALGWSSIFNQILSGFFFLLAFYFLLRHVQTGRRSDWAAHWIAFVLGLGALEINVVYPAIAAVYALLFSRSLVKRILPMFLVSAIAVLVHFRFAPAAATGPYAPRVDARLFTTLWTYWMWALGPVPLWVGLLMTAAVCLLAGWAIRRKQFVVLVCLAWFVLPLLPYLPLPEHRMDYYLAVPSIGIAMLGAFAVARWRQFGAAGRALAAICLVVYVGASARAAVRVTNWQYARGERVADLVLGVAEVHRRAPDHIVLLEAIDDDTFSSALADLPFRAFEIPRVYLAPGSGHVQYELPAAIARKALEKGLAQVYRFDGRQLHRTSGVELPTEDVPHLINLADSVFQDYFGTGWREVAGGYREMSGQASVRIGGPRSAGEDLYVGVFETRDFRLRVHANGVEVPVALASRGTDLSEYRATLPAALTGSREMAVTLEAGRSPLLFGYLQVR